MDVFSIVAVVLILLILFVLMIAVAKLYAVGIALFGTEKQGRRRANNPRYNGISTDCRKAKRRNQQQLNQKIISNEKVTNRTI